MDLYIPHIILFTKRFLRRRREEKNNTGDGISSLFPMWTHTECQLPHPSNVNAERELVEKYFVVSTLPHHQGG